MTIAAIVPPLDPRERPGGTVPPQDDISGVATRPRIVVEARSWIPTPYIKRGQVKHAGADCGMFPYAVLRQFDLISDLRESVPTLEDDWFCHTTDQRYARIVERYFRRLIEAQARREFAGAVACLPGNLVLVQSWGSRVYNHAGLITCWPRVIHCAPDTGVAEVDVAVDPFWAGHNIAVYDVLGRKEAAE